MDDFTGQADRAADRLAIADGRSGLDGHVPVLKPIGGAAMAAGLDRRAVDARALAESLPAQGVAAVAITIVDNGGIARVKTVPVTGLEHAARCGVGLSPVYSVAAADESFTACPSVGGPAGDLRLMPDPAALRLVAAQPGWAWVPADQYTQDGQVYGCCQRSFARRMTDLAGSQPEAANFEIKCFDQAANPYLAIGSVIAAGLAGLDRRLRLPAEVTGDPDPQTAGAGPGHCAERLPQSLDQALAALRQSEVIPAALGPMLYDAFTAVRAAEAETFRGNDPDTIAAAHRWIY